MPSRRGWAVPWPRRRTALKETTSRGFVAQLHTDGVRVTNDDGWASVFVEWLRGSKLNGKDALLIL